VANRGGGAVDAAMNTGPGVLSADRGHRGRRTRTGGRRTREGRRALRELREEPGVDAAEGAVRQERDRVAGVGAA